MKVGLYSTGLDVGDIPGKIGALVETIENTPWLAELYDLRPEMLAELRDIQSDLIDQGFQREYVIDQERVTAKLHMKAHLYFSEEAWAFLREPGVEDLFRIHFEELAAMNQALASGEYRDFQLYSDRLDPAAVEVAGEILQRPDEELSRMVMYLAVGSHNQNTRSLALDGEVAFITASWKSLAGLMDFMTVAGLCTWIDSVEELEELFPGYDGLARRISRFIRMSV